MEHAEGGELFDLIVDRHRLNEDLACKFFRSLIFGLKYIHSLNICHRDLKPENLLLDVNKDLKIVDFGLSNVYEVKGKDTLKTACGSPCYAAPEMIAGKAYHGDKVDVWSVGIVLYAMVCGYLPFEDPVTKKLYKKIMSADYKIPKYVSGTVKDLIMRVLNTDPDERYTISDIMAHPWFTRVTSFPWPLTSLNGEISQSDKEEYLNSETSGGVNPEVKPVPINYEVINILDEYGLSKDYAIKCVQMNKHNSVTSTYYLIIKNRKREIIEELKKQGKNFEDVVRNEKQQLMSLLKDFGGKKDGKKEKKERAKSKESPNRVPAKVDDQNVVQSKFNKTALKPIKIPEDPVEIAQENQKAKVEQMKQKIKARNESAESANRAASRKAIKRTNPHKVPVAEDEKSDGEVIMSNRDTNKHSPSPSPNKYDIEPRARKQRTFEIGPKPVKKTNFYSATNKKAKKYDYRSFEINNSMRQRSKAESGEGHMHVNSQPKHDSSSKFTVKRGVKEYVVKSKLQGYNNYKKKYTAPKDHNRGKTTSIESHPNNDMGLLSKSVDSRGPEDIIIDSGKYRHDMNQTIPVQHLAQFGKEAMERNDIHELGLKDSPYTSVYASKGKNEVEMDLQRKHFQGGELIKIGQQERSKYNEMQRMGMTQKIKVKSMPKTNPRKQKIRKQNWNTIVEDSAMLDNIMRNSRPGKSSKTKLNTTMAIYNKKTTFLPNTISSREAQNQSQNARGGKKKDMAYMKQMMNRTVFIQNQDHAGFNPHLAGTRHKINPRMNSKKKNSLVVPKQVIAGAKENSKRQQQILRQAYNQMHQNIKKFESKERSFERMPPKRHSSYEGRVQSDTGTKRQDPRLFVTQRNCSSTHKQSHDKVAKKYPNNEYAAGNEDFMYVRGKSNSSVQDYIKRASTGAGCNRHLQPRQNPLMGHSPRTTQKVHLTPSEKKRKNGKDSVYGKRPADAAKIAYMREMQNQSADKSFVAGQKAKRNRSSELISGYYKINRSKLSKNKFSMQ